MPHCKICADGALAAAVEHAMLSGAGIRGAAKGASISTNTVLRHARFHVPPDMQALFREASRASARRKLRGNQHWRGKARVLGKHGGQPGNQNAAKPKPESPTEKPESKNEGSNTTFDSKPDIGRGAYYILARLKRDQRKPTNSDRLGHDADFDQDNYGVVATRREAQALLAMCHDRRDIPAIRNGIPMTTSEECCLRKAGIPAQRTKIFRERVLAEFDRMAARDFENIQRRANVVRKRIKRREDREHAQRSAREKMEQRKADEWEIEEAYA